MRGRGRRGQNLRAAALERDGHRCKWPGCPATTGLEAHHIVPLADGGPDVLANAITLCKDHHLEAARLYKVEKNRRRRRSEGTR